MTITKRATKGSALTYNEMDENLRDLYEDTGIHRVLTNGSGANEQVHGTVVGIRGTTGGNTNAPETPTSRYGPILDIYRDVNRADEINSTTLLGAIAFSGRNEDDVKVCYSSIRAGISSDDNDGEHIGSSIVFSVADGTQGTAPFGSYLDDSFYYGQAIVANASSLRLQTVGYLESTEGILKLAGSQRLHKTSTGIGTQPTLNLYMPHTDQSKTISVGGMGPSSVTTFIGASTATTMTAASMLQYRGQHMLKYSAGAVTVTLPTVANNQYISLTTASVGDQWQISNAGAGATSNFKFALGTSAVYWVNGTSLVGPFTTGINIAVGGSIMLQAVGVGTYMIFNATGLTDA
jgi:hypothetical protein